MSNPTRPAMPIKSRLPDDLDKAYSHALDYAIELEQVWAPKVLAYMDHCEATIKRLTEELATLVDNNILAHAYVSAKELSERQIAKLEAILDGDPNQTETPETRRAWRHSAVMYADKCEATSKRLREASDRSIAWIDKAMDTGELDKQYIHMGHAKQELVRAALTEDT